MGEDGRFETYHRYEALTRLLHSMANAHPKLLRVDRIGNSHEGRPIWVATVTHFETGPDTDKPAFWVDGNIHATEVAPSTACLYLIHALVEGHAKDEDTRRCLDTRVFYICPRVNPDGAELALADRPRYLRSSTRPWPWDEDPVAGLVVEDIDGDGRILTMRVPDSNGNWKVCEQDPRLLVPREPTEVGGRYFRVLPEGSLLGFDGYQIQINPHKEGLDLNRNFPAGWRTEGEQKGAGPFPTSEPEVRCVVEFISEHPNITGATTFHTFSGVLLRPFSDKDDAQMPTEDLRAYTRIGEKATAITGYPCLSVFHDFRHDPKSVITGAFDDWAYEHLGIFAWTVELWSPCRQAGITGYKVIDWFREHPLEDDLKLLAWSDSELDGKGYVDWSPFDHPQLGPVEIGGWDSMYSLRNPPKHKLLAEIEPFPRWLVWHLLISPRLELVDVDVRHIRQDVHLIRMVVQNTGWLPTTVTAQARARGLVREVTFDLTLPEGSALLGCSSRQKRGQLDGRSTKASTPGADPTTDRTMAEWLVQANAGARLAIRAHHERAGAVNVEVTIGGGATSPDDPAA